MKIFLFSILNKLNVLPEWKILIISCDASSKSYQLSKFLYIVIFLLIILSSGGLIFSGMRISTLIYNHFIYKTERSRNVLLKKSYEYLSDSLTHILKTCDCESENLIQFSKRSSIQPDMYFEDITFFKKENLKSSQSSKNFELLNSGDGYKRSHVKSFNSSILPVNLSMVSFPENICNFDSILNFVNSFYIKNIKKSNDKVQIKQFDAESMESYLDLQYVELNKDGYCLKTEPEFICPTIGRISSHFGIRTDPVFEGTAHHNGIDIATPVGTPVMCAADGEVIYLGEKEFFGKVIIVQHFQTNYKTIYAHLNSFFLENIDTVYQGQIIGLVGNTGKSTGPHLHYEIRFLDSPINPLTYLLPLDTIAD